MQNYDPIAVQIRIYVQRCITFIVLAALLSLAAWLACVVGFYKVNTFANCWRASVTGYDGTNPTGWLVMRFCMALALTLTTCLYLTLALWWKSKSRTTHQRGAQLVERK